MNVVHDKLRVEVARSVPETEWQRRVEQCGGNALHLSAPHRAEQDPRDQRFLIFTRDQEIVACAIAFERRRRLWGRVPQGPPTLWMPTAPAMLDGGLAPHVLDALVTHARQSGCARLVIQPASSEHLDRHDLLARHTTAALVEFVLDLRRPFADILAGMHKYHRKNMRRAEARGLVVTEDTSLDGLLRLRQMQAVSAQRASEKEHGFSVRDEAYFKQLFAHVYAAGLGQVLFAHLGDKPLAALAFLTTAGRALTVRSGSLPEGYDTYAMYLLHHELIRSLLARGVVELNLGGVPAAASDPKHPQFGLYEFKQGFGGRAVTRLAVDMPLGAAS